MQETLDTIIAYHQSEANNSGIILHAPSAICDITDVANKLNRNLSVISLELILSFLLCINSDKEKIY